jgi:hypothetical protein
LTSYFNFNYVDSKKQLTLNGTWNGTSGVIASVGSQDSTQRTIFGFLNPITYVERGSYFQAWGNQATVSGSPVGGIAEVVLDGTGNKNNPYFLVSGVRSGPFYQDLFRIDLNNGLNYVRMHGYGLGFREAADLSKTQSTYIAGFATDGTVLDVPINTELYNTITSTTSPQTLSSTRADNLINQGGTQATFTLKLPASPVDGQVCMITYNNAITTLTIDGNGNTIVGSAVTTAVAGSQRKFKFYSGIGWIKQY